MKIFSHLVILLTLLLVQKTHGETTELEGAWFGSSAHTFFGCSYIFYFKGDSLSITLRSCNDVPDKCLNSRCFNVYYTGTFVMTRDSLLFKGYCADSTFKVNTINTGCQFGPSEVCDRSLNKQFRLTKDTLFLNQCAVDVCECSNVLIRKTTGAITKHNDNFPTLSHSTRISIFINNSSLQLKSPCKQSVRDLMIVNTQGKLVYREALIFGNKSLKLFPPGMYLLTARIDGGRILHQKFYIPF